MVAGVSKNPLEVLTVAGVVEPAGGSTGWLK
jgi:hypothetical protein